MTARLGDRLAYLVAEHGSSLTKAEILTASALLLYAARSGTAYPSASTLARITGLNRRTVERALAGLDRRGVTRTVSSVPRVRTVRAVCPDSQAGDYLRAVSGAAGSDEELPVERPATTGEATGSDAAESTGRATGNYRSARRSLPVDRPVEQDRTGTQTQARARDGEPPEGGGGRSSGGDPEPEPGDVPIESAGSRAAGCRALLAAAGLPTDGVAGRAVERHVETDGTPEDLAEILADVVGECSGLGGQVALVRARVNARAAEWAEATARTRRPRLLADVELVDAVAGELRRFGVRSRPGARAEAFVAAGGDLDVLRRLSTAAKRSATDAPAFLAACLGEPGRWESIVAGKRSRKPQRPAEDDASEPAPIGDVLRKASGALPGPMFGEAR